MCPPSGELTVSVRHWYFSLCMGICLVCKIPYQCRTDTVSSPDDGHIVAEISREVEINILRSSLHLVGFIWKR